MSNTIFGTFSLRQIASKMKPDVNLYHKLYSTTKGVNKLSETQVDEVIKIIERDSKKAVTQLKKLKTK
jgi:hypothetical protein